MLGKQHLFYGISTATALSIVFTGSDITQLNNPLMLIGGTAIGSILPDIDTKNSAIGKVCPILAAIVSYFIEHRTYTHDLAIILPLSVFLIWKYPLLFGLCLGYLGHILLDGCTTAGIPIFYLFNKKRIHLLPKPIRFNADSFIAKLATILFSCANIGLIYYINKFINIGI